MALEVPGVALAGVGDGGGFEAPGTVGTLAFAAFAGFCAVDEFATTECTGVAVTGNAAKFTKVWTLGRLLDGAG